MSNSRSLSKMFQIENMFAPIFISIGLLSAGLLSVFKYTNFAQNVLIFLLSIGGVLFAWTTMKQLIKGHFGVDIIALAAIVSSIILAEWWAGVVILLMLSTGNALEVYAMQRARKQLHAVLSNLPTVAHRKIDEHIEDVDPNSIVIGDTLVIKPGETVPTDGVVLSGISTVDISRITGEPLPMNVEPHTRLLAGSINQEGLLELRTLSDVAQSQYGRMIQLIKEAEQSKAPIVRLADTYSGTFTFVTFALASAAWAISGDPLRVLAVLVVATPCPLILATPIAIISGISRAAGKGIIVKHGGALEMLARVQAIIFDKTGTLTFGTPTIKDAFGFSIPNNEVLRLAASLDQASTHVLAGALIQYAKEKRLPMTFPLDMKEIAGKGVTGRIGTHRYAFGRLLFLESLGVHVPSDVKVEQDAQRALGVRTVYLSCDDALIGGVRFSDSLRPGLAEFITSFTKKRVGRIEMLTGDKKGAAQEVAKAIGITHVQAECLPEDKVVAIKTARKLFFPVAMVGDGINDSPALAEADVGIALVPDVAGMSSDAADIVITVNDITKVGEAHDIARRTISVAKTGIFIGMGLSISLMGLATLGIIAPLYGALLQEGIDILVIFNALRAHTSKSTNAE